MGAVLLTSFHHWGEACSKRDSLAPDAYRFEATLSLETDSQFWLERIKSEPLAKLAETLRSVCSLQETGGRFEVVSQFHTTRPIWWIGWNGISRHLGPTSFMLWLERPRPRLSLDQFRLSMDSLHLVSRELDLTSSLDLVSVFDLREPGLREPEDVRLPVWASRLGSQWGGNS